MNTAVIAVLAATSGAFGGIALGAQMSRLVGPAPREDVIAFSGVSAVVTVMTIAFAVLL